LRKPGRMKTPISGRFIRGFGSIAGTTPVSDVVKTILLSVILTMYEERKNGKFHR